MPLPSEIRAQEKAKKEAAGLGGDSEPVAAQAAPTPSPQPSPARKSWNQPAPKEEENLGWSSSDDDDKPVVVSKPTSKTISRPKPASKPAPAPEPAPEPVKSPTVVAPRRRSVQEMVNEAQDSAADQSLASEAAPPEDAASPTVVAPKRRSVADMVKQNQNKTEEKVVHIVKETKGVTAAAKAFTTKAKSNTTADSSLVTPSIFENKFSQDELKAYEKAFKEFDADGSGEIDLRELGITLKKLGMPMGKQEVKDFIQEFDLDKSGAINFGEFLSVMEKAKKGMIQGKAKDMVRTIQKGVEHQKVTSAKSSGYHGYTEEEKRFYASFINHALAGDPHCGHILPIDLDSEALFSAVHDGILACKMVNVAYPGTIDERVITTEPKNVFQKNQNATLALNAARSIGCQFVGIAAMDLINGEPHLVLALLWQLVKAAVLSHISLKEHPYLVRLLQEGETVADLMKLPAEKLLLRWVNFLLSESGCTRRIKNFGQDIKDSEALLRLLHRIDPAKCSLDPMESPDLSARAFGVLEGAGKLSISASLTATDITKGNSKMALIFVAELFNQYPSLAPLTEAESTEVNATATQMLDFNDEGTREERVFRLWINALGLEDVFVSNLFSDLADGYTLLMVLDSTYPGSVNWKASQRNPGTIYKRLENCNLAVSTAKQVGLKMTGIDGQNIADGSQMYVLAFLWQLWRANLADMLVKAGGNDKKPDEKTIAKWLNGKIASTGVSISGFKDKTLATSHALLHLLTALQSDSVDWGLVTDAETDEDKKSNAEYAISVARKIGCTIFTLPEDIVEVHPKQLMVLVAMMMLTELQN